MNIALIEGRLKKEGYHVFYHRGKLVVAKYSHKDGLTGRILCDFVCYAYVANEKYVVEDYDGALPVLEEFSTEAKACAAII